MFAVTVPSLLLCYTVSVSVYCCCVYIDRFVCLPAKKKISVQIFSTQFFHQTSNQKDRRGLSKLTDYDTSTNKKHSYLLNLFAWITNNKKIVIHLADPHLLLNVSVRGGSAQWEGGLTHVNTRLHLWDSEGKILRPSHWGWKLYRWIKERGCRCTHACAQIVSFEELEAITVCDISWAHTYGGCKAAAERVGRIWGHLLENKEAGVVHSQLICGLL